MGKRKKGGTKNLNSLLKMWKKILQNYKNNQSIYLSKFKFKPKAKILLSNDMIYFDDEKKGFSGLKEYELIFINNKPIYIFDNHNYALFPFLEISEIYEKKFEIVHIDAHRDNALFQDIELPQKINWKNLNWCLEKTRVSDYLDLATKTNLIGKIYNITQSWEFENFQLPKNVFILNLDIDIFGKDGEMVENNLKEQVIKKAWQNATAICIATSPGFIEQGKAKKMIFELLKL